MFFKGSKVAFVCLESQEFEQSAKIFLTFAGFNIVFAFQRLSLEPCGWETLVQWLG
jgi:hypothetical protein